MLEGTRAIMPEEEFDKFAENYRELNDEGLSLFGEKTEYFAAHKAAFLLQEVGSDFGGSILDYGCGIGVVARQLAIHLPKAEVSGFDVSPESIRVAKRSSAERERAPSGQPTFFSDRNGLREFYDIVVLANVLHHVMPPERAGLLREIARRLRPGGRIVMFEHNTLNPLVRYAVKRHPFDQSAVLVPVWEARKLLASANCSVRSDFILFFPSWLRWFRPMERLLGRCPLGAQYACVGEKRTAAAGA